MEELNEKKENGLIVDVHLKVTCDACGNELTTFGALIFSPPLRDNFVLQKTVEKYHICLKCWFKLKVFIGK